MKNLESVVNHPDHYDYGELEVIDVIEMSMPESWSCGFLLGNIIKYILRANRKNGLEDYKKAAWYLDRLIKVYEAEECEDEAVFGHE